MVKRLTSTAQNISSTYYPQYLEDLLACNYAACEATIKQLLTLEVDLKEIYTGFFQRSLYDVGRLWEQNKITVSKEHVATALTETLITLLYPALFTRPRAGRKAMIACGAEGTHRIGAKIVADYFELLGWDCEFLNEPLTFKHLAEKDDADFPDLLAHSLSLSFQIPLLEQELHLIKTHFPQLPMIVGGQAFAKIDDSAWQKKNGVTIVRNLDALETYLLQYECRKVGE